MPMNTSGGSGRVHELGSPSTHSYRVKKTVTPAVRLKIAKNKRFKTYGGKRHLSY